MLCNLPSSKRIINWMAPAPQHLCKDVPLRDYQMFVVVGGLAWNSTSFPYGFSRSMIFPSCRVLLALVVVFMKWQITSWVREALCASPIHDHLTHSLPGTRTAAVKWMSVKWTMVDMIAMYYDSYNENSNTSNSFFYSNIIVIIESQTS